MSRDLTSHVREFRTRAGFTQSFLADRVGVSRQALSAIEGGRHCPSAALSLRLARALGCTVEDLFTLRGDTIHARAISPLSRGQRVIISRIDDSTVAHALEEHSQAADGIVVHAGSPDTTVEITLVGDRQLAEERLIVSGCAPPLGAAVERLTQMGPSVRGRWLRRDSSSSLEQLRHGAVHMAGIHLESKDNPGFHARAAAEAIPDDDMALVTLVSWRQGLVVAPGNPLALDASPSLAQPGLRFAERPAGAGAQRLLTRTLASVGTDRRTTSHVVESHDAVADLIRWGAADVGVATEAAALAKGLDFVPLSEERFDLVVRADRLNDPRVGRFIDTLGTKAFKDDVGRVPGYDASASGETVTLRAARA